MGNNENFSFEYLTRSTSDPRKVEQLHLRSRRHAKCNSYPPYQDHISQTQNQAPSQLESEADTTN